MWGSGKNYCRPEFSILKYYKKQLSKALLMVPPVKILAKQPLSKRFRAFFKGFKL